MPKPNIGQGDSGETSLLGGGKKVPKDSPQIEATGMLDELISLMGYIRSLTKRKRVNSLLETIQDHLFRIESHISASEEWENHPSLPYIGEEHIRFLELEIAKYEKEVPELKNFIIPGGTQVSSLLHIARAQTRTVERRLVSVKRGGKLHPLAIPYVNRLSDVFFALARWVNHKEKKREAKWVGLGKKGL